jgi:hypothetical protein
VFPNPLADHDKSRRFARPGGLRGEATTVGCWTYSLRHHPLPLDCEKMGRLSLGAAAPAGASGMRRGHPRRGKTGAPSRPFHSSATIKRVWRSGTESNRARPIQLDRAPPPPSAPQCRRAGAQTRRPQVKRRLEAGKPTLASAASIRSAPRPPTDQQCGLTYRRHSHDHNRDARVIPGLCRHHRSGYSTAPARRCPCVN